jgi:hypothetical protein
MIDYVIRSHDVVMHAPMIMVNYDIIVPPYAFAYPSRITNGMKLKSTILDLLCCKNVKNLSQFDIF